MIEIADDHLGPGGAHLGHDIGMIGPQRHHLAAIRRQPRGDGGRSFGIVINQQNPEAHSHPLRSGAPLAPGDQNAG